MGRDVPWYSAADSAPALLTGRQAGLFYLVCYLRDGDRVFETCWTNGRGVEAMDNSYALMDLTVYGRQEPWEDSPPGWPQQATLVRTSSGEPDWAPAGGWPDGRPIAHGRGSPPAGPTTCAASAPSPSARTMTPAASPRGGRTA